VFWAAQEASGQNQSIVTGQQKTEIEATGEFDFGSQPTLDADDEPNVTASLRAKLNQMRMYALIKHAVALGIHDDDLDAADGKDAFVDWAAF